MKIEPYFISVSFTTLLIRGQLANYYSFLCEAAFDPGKKQFKAFNSNLQTSSRHKCDDCAAV